MSRYGSKEERLSKELVIEKCYEVDLIHFRYSGETHSRSYIQFLPVILRLTQGSL